MKISALVSLTGRPPRSPSGALRTLGAGLVGAAVLVLAGCGSGPDGGPKVDSLGDGKKNASKSADPSVVSKDPKQAGLQFSRCMRQHGVHQPDPDPNSNVTAIGGPNDSPQKVQEAMKACQKYLPGGDPDSPETKEKQRDLARCMRRHGVAMNDDGSYPKGRQPDPDKANKASKACGLGGKNSGSAQARG
ncbi:hypothetical protein [Streptomyces sp. NPDC001450]